MVLDGYLLDGKLKIRLEKMMQVWEEFLWIICWLLEIIFYPNWASSETEIILPV